MSNHSCNVQIERIKSYTNTEKYVALGQILAELSLHISYYKLLTIVFNSINFPEHFHKLYFNA